ncbi:hypothetical protein ACOYW6_04300 [Parablastomonas sp. CN1-191]|uniref:hypothetical protein n=1 Tax=Parablastomonas sp. CN1-191 TaxID=3400908 RepID=UPI003BF90C41
MKWAMAIAAALLGAGPVAAATIPAPYRGAWVVAGQPCVGEAAASDAIVRARSLYVAEFESRVLRVRQRRHRLAVVSDAPVTLTGGPQPVTRLTTLSLARRHGAMTIDGRPYRLCSRHPIELTIPIP